MSDTDALYDVRDRSGNPTHASVDDVLELVLRRARTPREGHRDAHFDEAMADVVDRSGEDAVRTVVHRVLVDHSTFRTATVGLEMSPLDGIRIGTTAGWFLEELNRDRDT